MTPLGFGTRNGRQGDRFAGQNRGAATLVAAVLMIAACGGGDDGDAVPTTTTSAPASTTTVTELEPTTTTRAPTTTTTRAPTPAPITTTTTTGSPGASGAAAAAPGRYSYDTTGTFTSPLGSTPRNGETVLTVDPAGGDQQRSVRAGPGRTVEQVLRFQGDGAYLVSLSITDSGFAQVVRPPVPVLAIPSPAPVGREWSWQAPTVDGRTTVSSSFKVARTEMVTVGGEAVPASVVEATITTTGDVASTGRQTFWYSERHRLIVQMQETTDGRVTAIAFRSESSDRLRSLRPA